MKVYTKTGDNGTTSFFGSERVRKDDLRISAYGDLDELNSMIGVVITYVEDVNVEKVLVRAQHDIFTVSAELASLTSSAKDNVPRIVKNHVEDIERMIDSIEEKLPVQHKFIVPGGTKTSAYLHLARCVCRRVERTMVGIDEHFNLSPHIMQYVNRLSDLLYVMARYCNKEVVPEQQPIYKYFGE